MIYHILRSASVIVCVGIQRGMQLYVNVRGKPASHRGADCCDYTKNKTRKHIKISEKKQYQKDVFTCVTLCVAPLRKVCYPQGNKGLKLADGNKQNLAYRYYCCTVGASVLMYKIHEN